MTKKINESPASLARKVEIRKGILLVCTGIAWSRVVRDRKKRSVIKKRHRTRKKSEASHR